MDVRPIRCAADHAWALDQLEIYFKNEPEPGSVDSDRFEILSTLVEAYEANHWAIPDANPIDVIRYAIDEMGRSQADFAELLGSRSHASEVLARKRPLSLDMIRKISEAWDIPASLLVSRYTLTDAA